VGSTKAKKQAKQLVAPVLPVRDAVHFPGLISTLLVGRDVSLRALQAALDKDRRIVVLTQKDVGVEDPAASDLHDVGVFSEAMQVLHVPDGTMRVVMRGIERVQVSSIAMRRSYFVATSIPVREKQAKGVEVDAMMREALRLFEEIMELGRQIPVEAMQLAMHTEDAGSLADVISHHLPIRPSAKQELLAEFSVRERMKSLLAVLRREREVLGLQNDIRGRVEKELGDTQREYYLREQLKIIQEELSEHDERGGEIEEYSAKIEAAGMPSETREKAAHELRRLERAPTASPEGMVIRTYLDWLCALPWQKLSNDELNVRHAKRILDRDHYGLAKVKDRVLDFLAVRQVSGSLRGPILCFVGPPGVGKTSIGKSIADALGRQFVRISLGGIRDEAEIRGHRRTYIGSMPGRIIQNIKACGTRNPVFMLDEVDKIGMDFRGDPTSALLEALDPEQNDKFADHYVEAPFDLSAVMFITTANVLENIPWALRDRMEVIEFPSYTEDEKVAIARDFLAPRQVAEHGLKPTQFKLADVHLRSIIREYTREAGVRNLEREIATLCRKTARQIAERTGKGSAFSQSRIHKFLGIPRFTFGVKEARDEIGAATGLVYTEFGGDVITIEVSLAPTSGADGRLTLTGQLGDVMKESAQAAVTCIRTNAKRLGFNGEANSEAHIHVPAGAVPKDGPSAGITIATAFASAMTGRRVRADVAMTGEITLRGNILPVGGLREKILAAHRAGIRHVLVPRGNARELSEIPATVRSDLQLYTVGKIDEVLRIALA
jgi:ATP-dependent Lon protease